MTFSPRPRRRNWKKYRHKPHKTRSDRPRRSESGRKTARAPSPLNTRARFLASRGVVWASRGVKVNATAVLVLETFLSTSNLDLLVETGVVWSTHSRTRFLCVVVCCVALCLSERAEEQSVWGAVYKYDLRGPRCYSTVGKPPDPPDCPFPSCVWPCILNTLSRPRPTFLLLLFLTKQISTRCSSSIWYCCCCCIFRVCINVKMFLTKTCLPCVDTWKHHWPVEFVVCYQVATTGDKLCITGYT